MAPSGYKNIENPNPTCQFDKRVIVVDPNTAPFIVKAFHLYACGDSSIWTIKDYLTKNGVMGKLGKPLCHSITYKILTNPFYYGLMTWGKVENMGKHEPLIDKETFDIVQGILRQKGDYGIRRRKHFFLLNGFVFCKDCGRRFVSEWHFGERFKGGKIGYYHCNGKGKRACNCLSPNVLLENLENQVKNEVAKLEFKPEFIEAVKRNIKSVYDGNVSGVKAIRKAIFNRKSGIERRRDKLEEELLAGTLDREAFKRLKQKIENELIEVEQELIKADKVRTVDMRVIEEVLSFTQNIAKTYESASPNQKKAYLRFFFQKIIVQNQEIVEVVYQPIIEVLQQANSVILSDSWLAKWNYFRLTCVA